MNKKGVTIIGAGFSGLSLAFFFNKLGYSVSIYESRPGPGGLIQDIKIPGTHVDTAANAVMINSYVDEILSDLEIAPKMANKSARRRFIFRGRPKQWPLGIWESLVCFIKILPYLLWNRKKLKPVPFESIESWGCRCFGQSFTQYVLSPALNGIYAGNIQSLSASLIVGKFFDKKSRPAGRKGLGSGEASMQDLLQKIYIQLQARGVVFHFSSKLLPPVSGSCFICAKADEASEFLRGTNNEVALQNADLLSKIEWLPLVRTTLTYAAPPKKIRGFGILFAQDQGLRALGVLQNSSIFSRPGDYSESWIFGGAADPKAIDLDDLALLEHIHLDRSKVYSEKSVKPLHHTIIRWRQALPHYSLQLEEILQKLRPMENLYLHGNYLGHLGLSGIAERSYNLVQEYHLKQQGKT